jgi:type IV pilus assembly protein PilV
VSMRLPPQNCPRRSAGQVGFTLLEVLVALVVLSIGLLGIGKLVIFSARGNDSAYMRTQATALAYTILDSMRANRDTAIAHGYDVATGSYSLTANCVTGSCSTSQLVQYDISQWKTNLGFYLPSGDGSIVTNTVTGADGNPRTTAVITVTWNDGVAQQTFAGTTGASTANVTLESIL